MRKRERSAPSSIFIQMLERRTQKMEMTGAYSHWRYNTVSALVPPLSARLHPQLQPALHHHHWLGTSEAHHHPGKGERLLFVPKLTPPICGVCLNCACFVCIYLSVWLLVGGGGGEGWQSDMDIQISMGPEPAWQWLALGDVWKPRRRTWIWEGGGQICSPLQQRWPRPSGSLRRGLR